jgi:ATP-dependent DNA helicase RecG
MMGRRLQATGDIGMNTSELRRLTALGEDSGRQFKEDVRNADSLAAEMVALSNSAGGVILIGVKDNGLIFGLSPSDLRRVNQLISNAATQGMRSPIVPRTENVRVGKERIIVVLTIPEGLDKPYFDRQGVIWVKAGPDKRRVQSKEELQRLFQAVGLVYADEVPTDAGMERVSRGRLREFVSEVFGEEIPDSQDDLARLLENMNLAHGGRLNLAGLLLFGEQPQSVKPAFMVKAVRYPGSDIASDTYLDMEDFEGTLPAQFEGALAFILRSLPKIQQKGRGVNSPGKLPIPRIVFEELLVNAIIHRDYFINGAVRVFIFDDRIEIISPGSLPNHLTVEKVRAGNSILRNPILASFAAKGVLPYRGLGTGIRRVLKEWPAVDLVNDREACTFTARVRLPKQQYVPGSKNKSIKGAITKGEDAPINAPINAPISNVLNAIQTRILKLIADNPHISYDDLVERLSKDRSTVMRNIGKLKEFGAIRRVGSRKTGHWEVITSD